MRRTRQILALAACLSVLWLQLSGAHLHADERGNISAPVTSYSHGAGRHHDHGGHHHRSHDDQRNMHGPTDEHDQDHATDVSLLDLALSSAKLPIAILALVLLFALLPYVRVLAGTDFVHPVLSGRHTRWRPPLRAPPQPA